MPSLNWIGKEAVTNHDKEVPFKLLKKVKSASVGKNSQNLIIHGDNLEALKSLMPFYYNSIKCIYIDPPYNTGNEKWIYNDKVNSPKIKQWLGKVVGRESEDLTRHDKWLCMMYPRLKLLRDLLSDDGAIFISIDDNEYSNLKLIMDDIFEEINFVTTIIWEKKYSPQNDARWFSDNHDFIICYAKNKLNWKPTPLSRTEKMDARYKNPDNDPKGPWKLITLHAKSGNKGGFKYKFKNGYIWEPPSGTYPRFSLETLKKYEEEGKIWFGKNGKSVPSVKNYLSEIKQGVTPLTLWRYDDVGHNHEAREDIKEIFDGNNVFDTPKPLRLLKRIIGLGTSAINDIVLDSFAGSATTAHAVLDLNKEDEGNRKFIMVEMEDAVAKDITAERVKRAIKKYKYDDGFEFCDLDKALFDENGHLEESCEFNQLSTYIYFTETQTNIDKNKINNNLIGELNDTEYYLIYKEKNKNDLNKSFLKKIKKTDNKKIIYADRCLIDDDTLLKYNIIFKQIPYEIKVY